jgi:hypothetical protein
MCGMFDQVALRAGAGSARWTWPDGFSALGAPAGFKQVNLSLFRCVYEAASRMCGMFDQVALRAGSVCWTWPCAPGHSALGAPAGFKHVNLSLVNC